MTPEDGSLVLTRPVSVLYRDVQFDGKALSRSLFKGVSHFVGGKRVHFMWRCRFAGSFTARQEHRSRQDARSYPARYNEEHGRHDTAALRSRAGARTTGRKTMTIAAKPRMTEDEFMRLPDDGRKYELVDGEPKEVPTGVQQDIIAGNLYAALRPVARGRGFLTIGQAGFRMASRNIRSPDVSFTRKERFPGGVPPEGFGDAAPDLCVEVISPSEEPAEIARKVREYFASGAEQVWHLFPENRTAKVFTAPTADVTLGPEDELDGGDLLPGFHSRVAELFELE